MGYREALTPEEIREQSRRALENRREYQRWHSQQIVPDVRVDPATGEEIRVLRAAPSGWQYGSKVKPTVAANRSEIIAKREQSEAKRKADFAKLSRRQKKRRRQLARRNAARRAETAALYDAIARLAEDNAAIRDYAASLEEQSQRSVIKQRLLRKAKAKQ